LCIFARKYNETIKAFEQRIILRMGKGGIFLKGILGNFKDLKTFQDSPFS